MRPPAQFLIGSGTEIEAYSIFLSFGKGLPFYRPPIFLFSSRVRLFQTVTPQCTAHPSAICGGVSWPEIAISTIYRPFEVTSKRRKSFPSETRVKRGHRFVHGDVELIEKLGRNDLCPCGSGRRFQEVLSQVETL
jgi:uncharacterized protein YchJ